MALINCQECGIEVSSAAKVCPRCGFALKKKVSTLSVISLILSFITCLNAIAIILALIDLLFGSKYEKHFLSGIAIVSSIITTILSLGLGLLAAIF